MTNEITMVPWRWGNPVERMVHYLVYDKIEGWTVSMYLEGVGWFARGVTPYVDPSEDDLLHRVTHRSSSKLLGMGPLAMTVKKWRVTAEDLASVIGCSTKEEYDIKVGGIGKIHKETIRRLGEENKAIGATHCRHYGNECSWNSQGYKMMTDLEYSTLPECHDETGWTKL